MTLFLAWIFKQIWTSNVNWSAEHFTAENKVVKMEDVQFYSDGIVTCMFFFCFFFEQLLSVPIRPCQLLWHLFRYLIGLDKTPVCLRRGVWPFRGRAPNRPKCWIHFRSYIYTSTSDTNWAFIVTFSIYCPAGLTYIFREIDWNCKFFCRPRSFTQIHYLARLSYCPLVAVCPFTVVSWQEEMWASVSKYGFHKYQILTDTVVGVSYYGYYYTEKNK